MKSRQNKTLFLSINPEEYKQIGRNVDGIHKILEIYGTVINTSYLSRRGYSTDSESRKELISLASTFLIYTENSHLNQDQLDDLLFAVNRFIPAYIIELTSLTVTPFSVIFHKVDVDDSNKVSNAIDSLVVISDEHVSLEYAGTNKLDVYLNSYGHDSPASPLRYLDKRFQKGDLVKIRRESTSPSKSIVHAIESWAVVINRPSIEEPAHVIILRSSARHVDVPGEIILIENNEVEYYFSSAW